jgi:predicted anti-sigma-YlaC factor YlaD
MRCGICRKLQPAYERNELSMAQRQAVGEHLASCAGCREAYAREEQLRALLPAATAAGAPHDLWPAVAARIAAREQQLVPASRRLWRPAAVLATAAAVAGLVAAFWGRPQVTVVDRIPAVEAMVAENLEAQIVRDDPWAGDVARALDSALTGGA